ncbi:SET domain-containing protein, partial [Rhizodiscina lignyota]
IRTTAHAGRSLIATRPIPRDTAILRTAPPLLAVVMREYRKEVCAHCFRYDRGRNLAVRSTSTGKSFCSEECRGLWEEEVEAELGGDLGEGANGLGVKSWEVVEDFVRRKGTANGAKDVVMHDVGDARPSLEDVSTAWADVKELGEAVRQARSAQAKGDALSKKQRKALNDALDSKSRIVDPDVLSLLLAGVLLRARSESAHPSDISPPSPYHTLLALAITRTPYPTSHNLIAHASSYPILLSLLPSPLLPFVTPSTLCFIPAHETHNSFGIRSLDDSGDEFLGYGVWADASLFNHSCRPNVGKAPGRTWTFWTTRDVAEGEELCISYLGGEEGTLGVQERRKRLWDTWGFECRCGKCDED